MNIPCIHASICLYTRTLAYAFVCISLSTSVHITACMTAWQHARAGYMCTYMYEYMCIYICIYICINIHIYIYICIYLCVFTCVCVEEYARRHAYANACNMYAFACIDLGLDIIACVFIYIYIYSYRYVRTLAWIQACRQGGREGVGRHTHTLM